MKRFFAKLLTMTACVLMLVPDAAAYDFRQKHIERDMSDVTPYIEKMWQAGQGDAATQSVAKSFEIDYSKAVHVPFVEMEAWEGFLKQAANDVWTEMPVGRDNWIVPVAVNGAEKEVAVLTEPFEQVKDGYGYSLSATEAAMYDFAFAPEEITAILHEGGLDACDDLRIYGVFYEGAMFITARQNGKIYIIPYTGAPADVWGSEDKTVVPAAEFYAGAKAYIEDLLTPKDWIGVGGGGAGTTNATQSQKTGFAVVFCLVSAAGIAWLWRRKKTA